MLGLQRGEQFVFHQAAPFYQGDVLHQHIAHLFSVEVVVVFEVFRPADFAEAPIQEIL